MKTLRPYQQAAVDAHWSFWDHGNDGNPLFVVPTGGGKSLIIAEFCKRVLAEYMGTRMIVLTHVKELIQQNYDEFAEHWGGTRCPAGIYSAGIGRRDTSQRLIFGGIQSVEPNREDLGQFDLVLIDEAHLVPMRSIGRYRRYIAWLTAQRPTLRVIGYTATPYRLDGGMLHEGDDRIFSDIAYEIPVELLVTEGHLASLRAKASRHEIDTKGVKTVGGDYHQGQLEEAVLTGDAVELAVDEMVQIARDEMRKSWLVFGVGIDHADRIAAHLRQTHGVDVATIFGKTPKDERQETIERFRRGDLTCIVNVGVLTTGFNAPRCDLMAVMRPTQSTSLYVQIMGRGMRTFEGKTDCLVLDYGNNVRRHGPIDRIEVRKPKAGEEAPPVKTCPNCMEFVPIAIMQCPACGHVFTKVEDERDPHEKRADELSPLSFMDEPIRKVVDDVGYYLHQKKGSPPSLRVDYFCGLDRYSEWVCLEHEGYARKKAEQWWRKRSGNDAPHEVIYALCETHTLRRPAEIEVEPDGKYWRIKKIRKWQTETETSHEDQSHSHPSE